MITVKLNQSWCNNRKSHNSYNMNRACYIDVLYAWVSHWTHTLRHTSMAAYLCLLWKVLDLLKWSSIDILYQKLGKFSSNLQNIVKIKFCFEAFWYVSINDYILSENVADSSSNFLNDSYLVAILVLNLFEQWHHFWSCNPLHIYV